MTLFGTGPIYGVTPRAGQTTLDYNGCPTLITNGSVTSQTISNDNHMSRLPRLKFSGALAGFRTVAPIVIPSNGSIGGFRFRLIFGLDDVNVVDDFRCFFGLSTSSAAPSDVEPDSLTQIIGVGCTGGDGAKVNDRFSSFSAGTAAQSGTATADNGSYDIAEGTMWELVITSPSDDAALYMALREHGNSSASTERTKHSFTAATRVDDATPLYLNCYASNGPSAGDVAITLMQAAWETSV